MVEKIGHVKNPLSVIAIFAGLAEVSGTVVLPFIAPENQATYIQFLIWFPVFLVAIFFVTLNFNHQVLYAPSDFKNENNFFKSRRKAATYEEKVNKLEEEVAEDQEAQRLSADERNDEGATNAKSILAPEENSKQAPNHKENRSEIEDDDWKLPKNAKNFADSENLYSEEELQIRRAGSHKIRPGTVSFRRVRMAEKLAIGKLTEELQIPFESDVAIKVTPNRDYIFDAFGMFKDTAHLVEVKLITTPANIQNRFKDALTAAETFSKDMPKGAELVLHLFLILADKDLDKFVIVHMMREAIKQYQIEVRLRVFYFNELAGR